MSLIIIIIIIIITTILTLLTIHPLHQSSLARCPRSMRSRVYVTVRCPSVCLFQSSAAAACGGFAAVGPAGRRYRWIAPQQNGAAARHAAANAGSGTFTADVGGWTQIYLYCCMMISCHDFYLSCRCRVPKPGHLDIRSAYRLVCHNYRVGQKSKLLMLSKYVNKTEKIGGTWTNTSQLFYV